MSLQSIAAQGHVMTPPAAVPENTRLTDLLAGMEARNERLSALTVQITKFANRLGADSPAVEPTSDSAPVTEPVGLVDQLEGRARIAADILDRLEEVGQRLDTVA